MTKNGGRIWAHDWENSGGPAGRKELADRCSLTMSLSGASASAAAKQRHQEQRRADTSALADAARGQRQMPELPPYVPEFDLAFMPQMLGVGAVRSEPEDPATGDDETIMQEAAVDVALQLLTDGEGLQALLASDEPSADRVALEGADNALANSRARVDQLYELVRASEGGAAVRRMGEAPKAPTMKTHSAVAVAFRAFSRFLQGRPSDARMMSAELLVDFAVWLATTRAQISRVDPTRMGRGKETVECFDNRQIRVFLVLRYISPLATSRSAVRPGMVRWSSASSIEPSNSGHRV